MSRSPRAPKLVAALLLVELLDELAGGALGAALPQIRTDLDLSYGQIGALFAIPAVVGNLMEVPFGVLAERGHRRRLVLAGGVAFTIALATMAGATTYAVLLAAAVAYYPASGAFVGLSQAILFDTAPERGEALMARWTLAGSVGVVAGPLMYAGVVAVGGDWRVALALVAALFVLGVLAMARVPIAEAPLDDDDKPAGWRDLVAAARRRSVLAAIGLLQLSALLGDVLTSFLPLYLVDVADLSIGTAALGLAVWAGAGLVGDALAVPVLDRLDGRVVVRSTAAVAGVLYAAMLVVDAVPAKLALLALLGLSTAGWYPVLQARLYATMPGRSGVAVSLGSLSGVLFGVVPLVLGLVAQRFGLEPMMWLLLAGPVVLLVGLHGRGQARRGSMRSGSSP